MLANFHVQIPRLGGAMVYVLASVLSALVVSDPRGIGHGELARERSEILDLSLIHI